MSALPPPSATIILLSQGTIVPGVFNVAPTAIPAGITDFIIEIDTSLLIDPAVTVDIVLQFSWDGGVTWPSQIGSTLTGSATPTPLMALGRGVDEPENPNRQVQGTVTVSGGSFVGSATLFTYQR